MRWESLLTRTMVGYVLVKGAIVGAVVVAVVHSGLPEFLQALIIAVVSAAIGAAGMIAGAVLAARATRAMIIRQDAMAEHVKDISGAVGTDKRRGDPS
jgi:hypothetical protein